MYCYFNEETQITVCYFPTQICTYYPDGTVECVPRFPFGRWLTPINFSLFAVILVSLVAIFAIAR